MAGKGKREVRRTHAEGVRHREEPAVSTRTMTTTWRRETPGHRTAVGDVEILPPPHRDGRAQGRPGLARPTLSAAARQSCRWLLWDARVVDCARSYNPIFVSCITLSVIIV